VGGECIHTDPPDINNWPTERSEVETSPNKRV